jgi:hypothetical protein
MVHSTCSGVLFYSSSGSPTNADLNWEILLSYMPITTVLSPCKTLVQGEARIRKGGSRVFPTPSSHLHVTSKRRVFRGSLYHYELTHVAKHLLNQAFYNPDYKKCSYRIRLRRQNFPQNRVPVQTKCS